MNKQPLVISTLGVALVAGLFSLTIGMDAYAKDAPSKRSAKASIPRVPDVAIPQSAFNIPVQANDGRNPFFPQSTPKLPSTPTPNPGTPIETTYFVLNGITSPPKRTAMINGRTFEPGEEGEVRLPTGGKMLIKVEDIKSESAVILVGGQRRELKLRAGV
jgi:hypothetical protein